MVLQIPEIWILVFKKLSLQDLNACLVTCQNWRAMCLSERRKRPLKLKSAFGLDFLRRNPDHTRIDCDISESPDEWISVLNTYTGLVELGLMLEGGQEAARIRTPLKSIIINDSSIQALRLYINFGVVKSMGDAAKTDEFLAFQSIRRSAQTSILDQLQNNEGCVCPDDLDLKEFSGAPPTLKTICCFTLSRGKIDACLIHVERLLVNLIRLDMLPSIQELVRRSPNMFFVQVLFYSCDKAHASRAVMNVSNDLFSATKSKTMVVLRGQELTIVLNRHGIDRISQQFA
jgi:hypothetical protein